MKEGKHWLYRPENIRKLWLWGFGILALSVIVQVVFTVHGHFGFDGWFAFNAVYGFFTCAVMVLFSKLLGVFVKRPDAYYQDDGGSEGDER
ncbi:MAG TPA: hypothetical protein VIT83_06690 [Gammaproteobacteria bacterium]